MNIMSDTNSKMVLTERTAPLQYIKETNEVDGKKYLGKLAGIGADFKNPTRNGRRYPLELWRNVENSDDFKEGMATHTIFGENDHPEDRIDTSIKEISIVLTKYEIREDEGIVWTEFDILDTPQGRILKSLLDYGSQIGVSSRGLGDEIVEGGETVIDPNTYVFYAWDAVVMPAVVSARPSVVESANRTTLKENFAKEVENATTKAELEAIKKIAESTNLPELDSLKESIDNKLNSIDNGKDISAKLESDLGKLAKENEELKSKVTNLEEQLNAKDIRLNEARDLLHKVRENSRTLSKQLQESKVSNAYLEDQIYDGAHETNLMCDKYDAEIDGLNKDLKEAKRTNRKLTKKLDEVTKRNNYLEGQVQLVESNNRAETDALIEEYENRLLDKDDRIGTLNGRLAESKKALSDAKKQKKLVEQNTQTEFSKLKTQLQNATEQNKSMLEKYAELLCKQHGVKYETLKNNLPKEYNILDVDRIVSELSDRNLRFSKLPIVQPRTTTVRLAESVGLSDEDAQTMEILGSVPKTH